MTPSAIARLKAAGAVAGPSAEAVGEPFRA